MPGQELEIVERDGRIEIEALSTPMRLAEREGFLAAECDGVEEATMSVDDVRDLLERTRR